MSTQNQMTKPQSTAVTLAQCASSDTWKAEIKKVLPQELVIEAFLRVGRTIASERKFAECDQKSFLGALLKCARAGLVPDGIHAHLIPFGKEVTCIFDWKGLVDLASRNGIQVIPKVICEHDHFEVMEDDGTGKTVVTHSWGMGNRGSIIGYYSRARRANGDTDYEFMTREEVEETRKNYSNARNSKAWEKSFDEMAKKTVIKRHSKRWPVSQEARAAMKDDDDTEAEVLAPEPTRPLFAAPVTANRPAIDAGMGAGGPLPGSGEPSGDATGSETVSGNPEPPMTEEQELKMMQDAQKRLQDNAANPLKRLRGALKLASIKENELMAYWTNNGTTDGSHSSLEEVFLQVPIVIEQTEKDFPAISEKIKEARKK